MLLRCSIAHAMPTQTRVSSFSLHLYITCQVELPTADLTGFLCAEDNIRHPFKYKSLRAACCNLPNAKELGNICTKVRVTA